MTDIKTDFKAWLQEHFSQSAASGYYSSVKKVFDKNFDGLTFENNMLIGPDEKFVREVLGEHVCPKFFLNLVTTLPLPAPANDNESQTEEKTDAEPEK